MFKIGEFSKITQVSIRMLRYYDEQKILVPEITDPVTGYRMYSADQIDRLNRIVLLRNMGFNVKEMKKLLTDWNTESLRGILTEQIEKTRSEIEAGENRLTQIQGFLSDLNNQERQLDIQVIIKEIPEYHVISLRRTVTDYYCEGLLWKELGERITGLEGHKSFSVYHDLDYREENVDIEVCVVVDEDYPNINGDLIFRQVNGVKTAASFMVYGPYSNISMAYREFAYWLEQHPEYRMSGENRQICHVSMCHTDEPEEYITELQIPLTYSN